ncbi:Phage integrase family protein [Prochlorococcus marinus str. MIT 1318]|nr:Phage integrase family protein [Prochlorococcus marinus str. MIT 1318]
MAKGTNTYRYKLIKSAYDLETAVEKCIEAYGELREEIKAIENGAALAKGNSDTKTKTEINNLGKYIKTPRQRSRDIQICVDEYLKLKQKEVDSGLLKINTYKIKDRSLRKQLIPYLISNGITKTIQISNNTFNSYPLWRKARKSTRRLELIIFKEFIENFCVMNSLVANEVNIKTMMPKIRITESELDANPPLTERGNWNEILKGLKVIRDRSDLKRNYRGIYFDRLFYRWCLIAKNSGLRPNIELNKLRWCDIKRENVGRWSSSDKVNKDKWVAVIHVRDTKTGKQRTVPTNGVDTQLKEWRKEQNAYVKEYFPWIQITDESLVFGNPANAMKQFEYTMFTSRWAKLMKILEGKLKPYIFSNRQYTIYSLRSTYICNLILQGKDIYTAAKLAGHTVAICERYYAKLDMGSRAKQVTDFKYGVKSRRKVDSASYMDDDINETKTKQTQSNWSQNDSDSYKRTSRKDKASINRSQTVTAEEQ